MLTRAALQHTLAAGHEEIREAVAEVHAAMASALAPTCLRYGLVAVARHVLQLILNPGFLIYFTKSHRAPGR